MKVIVLRPLSFMDIYDKTCFTVSSAGGRRGAQMATFDVGHPDVEDFIKAKREDGRLRQFNLSLLITNEFMEAVKKNKDWPLVFPLDPSLPESATIDLEDPKKIIWKQWTSTEGYITNEEGLVACKVYKIIKARKLWDLIMASTYDYAEPGFILIDRVNDMNNNWFDENIRATNFSRFLFAFLKRWIIGNENFFKGGGGKRIFAPDIGEFETKISCFL